MFPSVLSYIHKRRLYGKDVLSVLKSTLSPRRYEHTLNVASLSESLARRHGADPRKPASPASCTTRAGVTRPLLVAYVRRRRLKAPLRAAILASQPMLLHSYVSEDLARREFGVFDPEILCAVRRHTLGDRHLSLLDRILYVSDACAYDRTHATSASTRALAFVDLDAALKRCVCEKLICAISREAWLHPLTIALWNSLARL